MPMSPEQARALLLDALPLVERIVGAICRRKGLEAEEAEDLASAVRLKLIENEYAAIRSFEGRSSLSTWLMVIAQRTLLDHRNHLWGKWRASAEATRMGETARVVERLVHRDGCSVADAARFLSQGAARAVDEAEVEAILRKLPPRSPRPQLRPLDEAPAAPDPSPGPDQALLSAERDRIGRDASRILTERIERLAPEDRLLVRMRFFDSMPVPRIARAIGAEQRHLYHRISRIGSELRRALEQGGVDRSAIREILSEGASTLSIVMSENRPAGPSVGRGDGAPMSEGIGKR